jgi:hypothetical protein
MRIQLPLTPLCSTPFPSCTVLFPDPERIPSKSLGRPAKMAEASPAMNCAVLTPLAWALSVACMGRGRGICERQGRLAGWRGSGRVAWGREGGGGGIWGSRRVCARVCVWRRQKNADSVGMGVECDRSKRRCERGEKDCAAVRLTSLCSPVPLMTRSLQRQSLA